MGNEEDYFDELKIWQNEVGKAILGFGEVELSTLKLVNYFDDNNLKKSINNIPLKVRIEKICFHLKSRYDESDIGYLLGKLLEAKELIKYRNILAHNPLVAEVFEKRNQEAQLLISSSVNAEDKIDLETLKKISNDIEIIASDIWVAIVDFVCIDDI